MKIISLTLKDIQLSLTELDFYIYVTFLLRCQQEFEWHLMKTPQERIMLFSCKPSFLYATLDVQIGIVLQGKRYDFAPDSFATYADYLYQMLDTSRHFPALDYRKLDPVFMEYMLSVDLPYLYAVKSEEVYLDDLHIYVSNNTSQRIADSKYFEMMKGEQIQNTLTKTNLNQQSHEERVRLLLQNLEQGFHPEKSTIILYNDSNIIRDGSHRAGWLYRKYGNIKIKVLRMYFSQNYYLYCNYKSSQTEDIPASLFSSTMNTRWLKINGKETCILRSDSLKNLQPSDTALLHQMSVKNIIDLRCLKAQSQNKMLCQEFSYVNIPLSYIIPSSNNPEQETERCYLHIISQMKQIGKLLRIIMHMHGNTVVFCAVGRDRTGIVCAILQMICGCTDTEIIEEYSISDHIYERTDFGKEKKFSYTASQIGMIRFLDTFYQKYGSVEHYLSLVGISPDEIEAIRNKIIK